MLESFLKYKIESYKKLLASSSISEEEKEKYERFFKTCVSVDADGRLIINNDLIKELKEYIKDNKNSIVMNVKDTIVTIGYDVPELSSLDNLVAIHVTKIPPKEDTIKTKENSGVKKTLSFSDPSTRLDHYVEYLLGSDTIHFTLNCVVQNHSVGNDWASYDYGILVDFNNLDKDKVLDVKGEDTYLDGDVKLSNYFLFCPLGEREKILKDNPNAIIIEYDGITLSEAMSQMIILTGNKLENYGTYGWDRNVEYSNDTIDSLKLEKLSIENGYPVLKGRFGNALHSETKYMARRMWKTEYYALINLLEYNKENGIEMPDEVIFPILLKNGVYCYPGNVPVTIEDFKDAIFPILNSYGYDIDDSLFDGISIDSNEKIMYPPNVYEIPAWEHEIRNRVITIIKNKSKRK